MKPLRHSRPVDQAATSADPREVARELERQRALGEAHRADELARARAEAGHKRARADVVEELRRAELARAEREAQIRADVDLARLHRQALAAGERTRIGFELARTGEARALRLERLRALNLKVLIPVLLAFGLWSTTGVQKGASWLMSVGIGSPMWWALWVLEPALIGAVVWIIIVRARLASAGGHLAPAADVILAACLLTSIGLNIVAGGAPWNTPSDWSILGAMIAHAIGPVGAAVTAHLIGVVDSSIAAADPWHENGTPVPRLAEMDLRLPTMFESASAAAPERTPESACEDAPETAVVNASKTTPKSAAESGRGTASGAARKRTKATKSPSARALSDQELAEQLAELVTDGRIGWDAADGPAVRAVQRALGIGFDRAKCVIPQAERLLTQAREHGTSVVPALHAVDAEAVTA